MRSLLVLISLSGCESTLIPPQNAAPAGVVGAAISYDLNRERVVLFGGAWPGDSPSEDVLLGETWEFDGAQWHRITNTGPDPRANASMVYDPIHRRSILWAGYTHKAPDGLEDIWAWDGSNWTELELPSKLEGIGGKLIYNSDDGEIYLYLGGPGPIEVWRLTDEGWLKR